MATHLNGEKKNNWLNITNQLIKFLQDSLSKCQLDGYILGVSGGIDSAICAVLLKKACPKQCHFYFLDCYNYDLDRKCVEELNKKFYLNIKTINLNKIYDSFVQINDFANLNSTAKANIKPRIRMIALYAYANNYNSLVVGTTNKCEKVLGYFTKFGDGAYDLSLLEDFNKEEIFSLAKYLNIPKIIINRKPSASLYKDQTDEKDLGLSYKNIDKYLNLQLDNLKIKKKILNIETKNKHKQNPPIKPNIFRF